MASGFVVGEIMTPRQQVLKRIREAEETVIRMANTHVPVWSRDEMGKALRYLVRKAKEGR